MPRIGAPKDCRFDSRELLSNLSRHRAPQRAGTNKEIQVVTMIGGLAQVSSSPSSDGLPGAAFWQRILNWLSWAGLAGSLASLLIGGAVWGLSHAAGNSMHASRGKVFAIGGIAGALLTGMAPTIVNSLFSSAGG